ncbi:hypothetical protein CONLIGDRAFT_53821 [Coniochaeta ligniaria NRRL 30616]|uniref:Uncharacterized protein n=1 Tax=Coniochaeta ligniaria NRRL 30616 TaxID=1408157 RepID=A0A1J7J7J7_9PEZI|nr:hypothetical protein CONLIGDRAFT_53821 [Coniochaeta ligniaria NRRL 30616]
MKASLITLLPLACFMQSALAAPALAGNNRRSIVGSPTRSTEVAKRGLLDGLLGSSGSSSTNDITDIPQLGQLSVLVTNVVNLVEAIDATITGAGTGNVTSIIPQLTSQLGALQTALAPLSGILSGLTGGDLTQGAGVATLLARLYNALATLVAQLSTATSQDLPALTPITRLVSQILTSVGPVLNLGLLNIL